MKHKYSITDIGLTFIDIILSSLHCLQIKQRLTYV